MVVLIFCLKCCQNTGNVFTKFHNNPVLRKVLQIDDISEAQPAPHELQSPLAHRHDPELCPYLALEVKETPTHANMQKICQSEYHECKIWMDAEEFATARRPLMYRLVESRPSFTQPAASRGLCSWKLGSQLTKNTCPSQSYTRVLHSKSFWRVRRIFYSQEAHHFTASWIRSEAIFAFFKCFSIQRLNIFQPFRHKGL